MSFTVPTFNLVCNISTGPYLSRHIRLANQACNLARGRRAAVASNIDPFELLSYTQMELLLPALTDVRDLSCSGIEDVVECPAFSGRWYQVIGVDDVGKGFTNEYRVAILQKIYETIDPVDYLGLFWPTPIP